MVIHFHTKIDSSAFSRKTEVEMFFYLPLSSSVSFAKKQKAATFPSEGCDCFPLLFGGLMVLCFFFLLSEACTDSSSKELCRAGADSEKRKLPSAAIGCLGVKHIHLYSLT